MSHGLNFWSAFIYVVTMGLVRRCSAFAAMAVGVFLASSTEAAPAGDDTVSEIGGRCPADQHVCGGSNTWTCCGEHAVCCHPPGGNPHCGYGTHPCR
jgi:hypothetical protein